MRTELSVTAFLDHRADPLRQIGPRLAFASVTRDRAGESAPVPCVDMTFRVLEEGAAWPESAMPWLGFDGAQRLMDSLWRCGIRPTEGAGSAGQREALERHLMDMRAIVSERLKVKL